MVGSDLGIATGLAFTPDGALFVGDRSGTLFPIDAQGRTETVASFPGSMAAFHLAVGPDGCNDIAAPTLSTYDTLRRVHPDGRMETLEWVFGRPQGVAFDRTGVLHVVEALAGSSGVYASRPGRPRELVVSGPNLVGLAFAPDRGIGRRLERHALRLCCPSRPVAVRASIGPRAFGRTSKAPLGLAGGEERVTRCRPLACAQC